MTHQWTNEDIDWAVDLCLDHYRKGTRNFSIALFPRNIPGTRGTGTKVPDRYQLLLFALGRIVNKNIFLRAYPTGGTGKSTSEINLISAYDPNGYFDSELLCNHVLWHLPPDIVSEEFMAPLMSLATMAGADYESPQHMISENQTTFDESKGMWSEIASLFCVKQLKGAITRKDLYMQWDKDFAEYIFLQASVLIAFYKVVKIGWHLEDLTFGGRYNDYNQLFLHVIWGRCFEFLMNELFPPPTNPVTVYNLQKKIDGYRDLGENNYSPKKQGGGNEYTEDYARKAGKRLWEMWETNLRITREDAGIAAGLHVLEALETNCDPDLLKAIDEWQQENRLRRNHDLKRLNRFRNAKNTTSCNQKKGFFLDCDSHEIRN
jgi:hypothetical protein